MSYTGHLYIGGMGCYLPAEMQSVYSTAPGNWVNNLEGLQNILKNVKTGTHGIMVITLGNVHSDPISKSGQRCLHFTVHS